MTHPQVVRIQALGPDKTVLSKAQKEFNQLTKLIGELEIELENFRTAATHIQQRIQTEYGPLLRKYNEHRANLVRLFDRMHDRPETTKSERTKLADLIVDLAHDLIGQHGMNELKPIVAKYDTTDLDAVDADADGQVSDAMKERMMSMYGIRFDENIDVSTPEKFMAYVEEQLRARQAEREQRRQANEEPHIKKPKSAKHQEREAKRLTEERNTAKAVRALYLDLVRAFHPDREPDEAEKARKTSIMQRITEAYEKSDLLALFRLQLEASRIDQAHLETLAEEQLTYYNRILKQQADGLGEELLSQQRHLSAVLGNPLTTVDAARSLEQSFDADVRALKRRVKEVKRELNELSVPAYLKGWLKTYNV